VCTRIYRFFNPERDEESSDYHSSPSPSSSDSSRHRFRNCFGTFFPLLNRDSTPKPGRAGEPRRGITLSLSLALFSFRSLFSSRRTRGGSNTRLSFSSVETREFNFESRADMERGTGKRSNQNLEEEGDGRKGREDEKKSIPPGVLSIPSLPSSTSSPSSPSSSAPESGHPDLRPPTSLKPLRCSPFRPRVGRGVISAPLPPVEEGDIGARSAPT
jgi:hypothetical protein